MSDHDAFFRERRAAAAFKHGILKRYPVVFASKTGSATTGNRVVFLDGYAGPGRYDDGSPGSPVLLAECAEFVKGFRNVTGYFVERDDSLFASLRQTLDDRGDKRLIALHGDVNDHLSDVLARSRDAALFAFLDPFGVALDRDRLVRDLLGRGLRPPTEVMLHISVSTVARIGGLLRQARLRDRPLSATDELTMGHVDRFFGGTWWRHHFSDIDESSDVAATQVALHVADVFRDEVAQSTGFQSVAMPVRMRMSEQPRYVLVLFTRHPDGVWYFLDALGQAGRDWHSAIHAEGEARERLRAEVMGQGSLFEVPAGFDPDVYESRHAAGWSSTIARNIVSTLRAAGRIRLDARAVEVYGTTLVSRY